MSFVERMITVRMMLNPAYGATFDGSNDTVELRGLRIQATVQSTMGGSTPYQSLAQLRISGMREQDMAKLSTLGFTDGTYNRNFIEISAGDRITGMTSIFTGSITSGNVDYNAMPDVGVDLVASATIEAQVMTIAASSYKGVMNVADMLQGITSSMTPPMGFENNGVTASLRDHAVGGSAWEQIRDICHAAGIGHGVRPGTRTLVIWPIGKGIDDSVITIDAASGLVGYPMYTIRGVDVVSIFNPNIQFGRQMKITSAIPAPGKTAPFSGTGAQPVGASGTFYIIDVVHDLSSMTPGGPWFTRAQLSGSEVARAQ